MRRMSREGCWSLGAAEAAPSAIHDGRAVATVKVVERLGEKARDALTLSRRWREAPTR